MKKFALIILLFLAFTPLAFGYKLPEINRLDRAVSVRNNSGSVVLYDVDMTTISPDAALVNNSDGTITLNLATGLSGNYLLLNQSTPQTVTGGAPNFFGGLTLRGLFDVTQLVKGSNVDFFSGLTYAGGVNGDGIQVWRNSARCEIYVTSGGACTFSGSGFTALSANGGTDFVEIDGSSIDFNQYSSTDNPAITFWGLITADGVKKKVSHLLTADGYYRVYGSSVNILSEILAMPLLIDSTQSLVNNGNLLRVAGNADISGTLGAGAITVTSLTDSGLTAYMPVCGGITSAGVLQSAATGTQYYPLCYNTSGSLPSFQLLPIAGGGTGVVTLTTPYGLLAAGTTATGAVQTLVAGATTQILVGGGASALPSWGTNLPTAVTIGSGYIYRAGGTDIAVADGGTNISSYAVGDMLYASAATTLSPLADVGVGSYLRSGGVTTAPLWSTLILPNAATSGRVVYASGANTYGETSALTLTSAGLLTLTGTATTDGFTLTGAIAQKAIDGVAGASGTVGSIITLNTGTGGSSSNNIYGGYGGNFGLTTGAGATNSRASGGLGGYGGTIRFTGGAGGSASGTGGTTQGGYGAEVDLYSGYGGSQNSITGSYTSTGGPGGALQFISAVGGSVRTASRVGDNVGGAGGIFTMTAGGGGRVSGSQGQNISGAGGYFTLASGFGGAVTSTGGTTNLGGTAGDFTFTGAAGGSCTGGSVSNTGGTGGSMFLNCGLGGVATGTNAVNGANGNIVFRLSAIGGGFTEFARFDNAYGTAGETVGRFGIGIAPTAFLHIKAGTATAGTAPIKLTAGAITTAAVSGQFETDASNNLYYTNATPTRGQIPLATSANTLFFTTTGVTSVTLPTTGTLAILGANSFVGDQTYTSTYKAIFNAATEYINSATAGHLDLNAATSIDLNAPIYTTSPFNSAATQTTTNGLTGTAVSSQPFQGTSYKKAVLYLTNFTSAGSVITFPTAFTNTPYVYGDAAVMAIAVTTTTTVTLTSVGAVAGNLFIEGS